MEASTQIPTLEQIVEDVKEAFKLYPQKATLIISLPNSRLLQVTRENYLLEIYSYYNV